MGLNLGESKQNFLFAKNSFGMNVKGQRKTLVAKRGWKTAHNEPLNGNYQPLKPIFVLGFNLPLRPH